MSNYALAVRMYPEIARVLAYTSLSTTYVLLGSAIDNPSLQTIIQNWTDINVWISWDGINNHLPLASGCAWDSDNVTNAARDSGLYIPQGQKFYVMQYDSTAATTGAVLLTTFYGQGV